MCFLTTLKHTHTHIVKTHVYVFKKQKVNKTELLQIFILLKCFCKKCFS